LRFGVGWAAAMALSINVRCDAASFEDDGNVPVLKCSLSLTIPVQALVETIHANFSLPSATPHVKKADQEGGLGASLAYSDVSLQTLVEHVDELREYLRVYPEEKDAIRQGATPLILAASGGHLEAMDALIESGANLDKPGSDGITPLLKAAENSQREAISLLLREGADVWQVIPYLMRRPSPSVLRELIAARADVNEPSRDGITIADSLALSGGRADFKELMATLREVGANLQTLRV